MFENWLEHVAETLGCTSTVAGYIMGLIFTMAVLMVMVMASKGRNIFGPMASIYFSCILFTILGWYDLWVVMLLVLITAAMYSGKIKDWLGGSGSG